MPKRLLHLLPILVVLTAWMARTVPALPMNDDPQQTDLVKIRVHPVTMDQVEMLKSLERFNLSEIPATRTDRDYHYQLPSSAVDLLKATQIPFETMSRDTNFWTDEYYFSYQEVYDILTTVSRNYPEIASIESLGVSTRDSVTIWGLKISDNPEQQEDEIDIYFDAVTHAREPVNVNVCMALIDTLITNYGVDSTITHFVDNSEIWIVPIKNVEGYLFVETGIEDPWWRKNKRDNNENGIFDGLVYEWCVDYFPSMPDGVDLNRNYAEGWFNAGSPEPCHIVYRGPSSFSENETQMERDLVAREAMVGGICFHSYSEYVGYCGQDPAGIDLCGEIALAITRENGFSPYDCSTFYGSGQSYNWMYREYGVQGYLIETGTEFIPSGHDRIGQIVRENVDGCFALLQRVHGSSIIGNVYDSETLEPLVADVSIEGEYPINNPRRSEANFGRFYKMVRPDVYVLHVRKEGYEDFINPIVIVDDGSPTYVDVPLVESTTGIQDRDPAGAIHVRTFSATQNYPNPFNPSTTIGYSIPREENPVHVRLSIFDIRGRKVRSLVDEEKESGAYQVHWNGRNERGEEVPSGVYLYRLEAGEYRCTHKMVLTR